MISGTSFCATVAAVLALVAPVQAANEAAGANSDGLVTLQSRHSVDDTLNRLEAALEEKGLTVFTHIDHAQGAEKAGLKMRDTQVLIFGNPEIGTPIMKCAPAAAVDFPQKALVWEDAEGEVWLAYNDPHYLVERHDIEGCEAQVQKMSEALDNLARGATGASGP